MKTRNKFENLILEKAMKDETFRANLIENPGKTIEKEFGVKIPDSAEIRILEEKSDTFYLVLPAKQKKNEAEELTEAELKSVAAGGKGWEFLPTTILK